MSQNNDTGKLLSLHQMLTDREEVVHKILIPKFQRDYAQGRDGKEDLRERFLKSIFDVIDADGRDPLILDFVFGRQRQTSVQNIFLPVDGQQRLTTLFLLHLYVGRRAGAETDFLKKFSYETRESSKQFCERLHEIPSHAFVNVKDYIEKQWWFTGMWKIDPTIKAMITMLAHIDTEYQKKNLTREEFAEIWKRLTSKENPKVLFWRLYLTDLQQDDELYIKMNSRGKELTAFEHFKALLDEYTESGGRLAMKIDTDWTRLLWGYCTGNAADLLNKEKYVNNRLDDYLRNLISFYLTIEGSKIGIIDYSTKEYDMLRLADQVLGHNLETAKKIMGRFERVLDFFCTNGIIFNRYMQAQGTPCRDPKVYVGPGEIDLLKLACEKGLGIDNKSALYLEAFFEFAANGGNEPDFANRLRVLRNLVENTEIHARDFKSLLAETDSLIATGNHTVAGATGSFNQKQKEQEDEKAKWIAANPARFVDLKNFENHHLIMGNISVAIDPAANAWDIDANTFNRFGRLFCPNRTDDDGFWLERALLTEGDYGALISDRYQIKSYNLFDPGRYKLIQAFGYDSTHEVLRKFLNRYQNFAQSDLRAIVEGYVATNEYPWEYYLLKYAAIYDAPYRKYHLRGGRYQYDKLNANGGGGKELYWNAFNLALMFELRGCGCECEIDDKGGPLTLMPSEKTVDFGESELTIDGVATPIPQNANGVDTVDRILWAKNLVANDFAASHN